MKKAKKRAFEITTKFDKMLDREVAYIAQESPEAARTFDKSVQEKLTLIEKNPEAFAPEDILNKRNKRTLYRSAVHQKNWKIVYKVLKSLTAVLGIVHVRRHEREIKKLRTTKYD
jgi:plasmid stabilization system protein ParE